MPNNNYKTQGVFSFVLFSSRTSRTTEGLDLCGVPQGATSSLVGPFAKRVSGADQLSTLIEKVAHIDGVLQRDIESTEADGIFLGLGMAWIPRSEILRYEWCQLTMMLQYSSKAKGQNGDMV